ncbi:MULTISPECIES: PAS domain-containing protein [Moorena]|uniref:PAS domain-containing protein n=1 Tax=Moorena TaxID=1155738 RepID=UPI0002F40D67|nr:MULTISPECIES: PAS domain-containing protein [Moorena]NEP68369.1 PAS domain-containing protein [Moorena sp. SIO3A5]NEQ06681.1 PAS domain-containing protein [Moorena sp. SIO4E2]NER86220.1 PAS domain-containing protein [Moorena sp. SIO3A2]NES43003.1 PAS domain-containing protein [Moorena sp. SIO2C4]NET62997.1 PAS domain-containing protein [Moorena sp. SIO1G6]
MNINDDTVFKALLSSLNTNPGFDFTKHQIPGQKCLKIESLDPKQSSLKPELLYAALEELSTGFEELSEKYEALQAAYAVLQARQQHYHNLFELAPEGYLVTNAQGIIQEANSAAASLLNVQQYYLVGKPLMSFISEAESNRFDLQLHQLQELQKLKDWQVVLCPRQGKPVAVDMSVSVCCDSQGNVVSIQWIILNVTGF